MKLPVTPIHKRVELAPIVDGNRVVRPIAYLKGWQTTFGARRPISGGVGLRLVPVEVVIQEGDETYCVAIADPLRNSLRRMALSGLLMSGICLLIMWVGGRMAKRSTDST